MAVCEHCGHDNDPGAKFCNGCGAALTQPCPRLRQQRIRRAARFCSECGAALSAATAPVQARRPTLRDQPSERRLVSVLFADLVGFTPLSESRDAEEVRALLSRYFDTCRRLIELYGGTVEKFIGDAVMAVWGTPTATEDDAERAVRAALDLVAAVSALGQEVGAEELRARAGVLTGEAAVTLARSARAWWRATSSTPRRGCSRSPSPGSVLVGEATRRATEQAIVYEDAGSFELKGKEGKTRLWRALRVVSGVRRPAEVGGARGAVRRPRPRAAPDQGPVPRLRRREPGAAGLGDRDRRDRQVAAGVGVLQVLRRPRPDDLLAPRPLPRLRRGRHLLGAGGHGADALPDRRGRRARPRRSRSCGRRSRSTCSTPTSGASSSRGWRSCSASASTRPATGRICSPPGGCSSSGSPTTYPTVLAFEDMQWADASLLDFVEYLLEWSRNHPLFVVTLARPELVERRPTWGAGHRNFTSLYLEPLSEAAMEELLAGLVPGLPAPLRDQILARAEGVPLYAVETVRMLLDRGLLVEEGSVVPGRRRDRVARGAGDAARADRRPPRRPLARRAAAGRRRRRARQDVHAGGAGRADAGSSRTGARAAARRPRAQGGARSAVRPALARARPVRLPAGPAPPGRLRDAAEARAPGEAPGGRRAPPRRARPRTRSPRWSPRTSRRLPARPRRRRRGAVCGEGAARRSSRAGERAASLGASAEAQRYFEQAAELRPTPREQAAAALPRRRDGDDRRPRPSRRGRAVRAGDRALRSGRRHARGRPRHRAGSPCRSRPSGQLESGDRADGARVRGGRRRRARRRPRDPRSSASASAHCFAGDLERAAEWIERALDIGEALELPEMLVRGWTRKGDRHRAAAPRGGARPAPARARRPRSSTSCRGIAARRVREPLRPRLPARPLRRVARLSRADCSSSRAGSGDRRSEWFALSEMTYALTMLGRWDEALARLAELPDEQLGRYAQH